eukprot:6915629-Pyramimonas_sp.AAC.1
MVFARQSPKDPDQTHLTFEIVWDPHEQKVRVVDVNGQPFGGALSQFNYVQDPAVMVAIGRSMLMLPVSHNADDEWGVEPARLAQQVHRLWIDLNTL